MEDLKLKKLLLGTSLLTGFAMFGLATPAFAQDATDTEEPVAVETIDDEEEERSSDGEVVVTGSRIKRDTFTSIAPLQVITGEVSREAGLFDPAEILQSSTAATGQQIDQTFQGFVLDDGPGSSTVNLRGLGANRTLPLINGRRVAPAGVEGAPTSPDLNLLPRNLVAQYDILLDGASSVYGSDAVAGVTNAILRRDYEGFEIQGSIDESEYGGGSRTISAAYGLNTDRGFLGFGAEFTESDEVKFADRPWTDTCNKHYEIDENGEIRTVGLALNYALNQRTSECKDTALVGRISAPGFGSVYYRQGSSNSNIPNFNESALFGVPVDFDGDGVSDISWVDFSLNGAENELVSLYPDYQRYSLMAYGETTVGENAMNLTPYFEALFSERETQSYSGSAQLFPTVVAENAFNPCGVNGVDCGLAYDALLRDPRFAADFAGVYGITPQQFFDFGIVNLFQGAIGPRSVLPIVAVQGDRNFVSSKVNQLRLVAGAKFDMPVLNGIGLSDWSGDVSIVHSHGNGQSTRTGVNEAKLNFALGQEFNAFGQTVATAGPCIAGSNPNLSAADMAGCVPVNMFAPSLYDPLVGDFATQAERDYVFSDRNFDTTYKQTILSAYAQGSLMEVPAGSIKALVGGEIRIDELESDPNEVASQGQLFGFFVDEGAEGRKTTKELYGEVVVPIVANQTMFKQLDMELSGRYTNDEFYGGAGTYSAKFGWRPVDSLLVRGTIGTSFRAPNLRELFLKNQSGFLNVFDPCSVPQDAVDPITGYNPALDGREATTLENCRLAGLDPTSFNSGSATGAYSIEINRAGALYDPALGIDGLDPETSTSKSLGFVFEQPFTDAFDLTMSASYYNINVEDAIIELTPTFVVFDCYVVQAQLSSPRCGEITRAANGFISNVKAGFQNLGGFETSGIDFNALYGHEFNIGKYPIDLNIDLRANYTEKLVQESFNTLTRRFEPEDFVGQPSVPEWTGLFRAFVDVEDLRFVWTTNFIQGTEVADEDKDTFSNVVDGLSDTCLGPTLGDVNCRDVDFLPDYWLHSGSVSLRKDKYTITVGVRNIFDKEPPLVDSSEILSRNNVPIGSGYHLNGRTFFASARYNF